jgi:hypothetical protein
MQTGRRTDRHCLWAAHLQVAAQAAERSLSESAARLDAAIAPDAVRARAKADVEALLKERERDMGAQWAGLQPVEAAYLADDGRPPRAGRT